MKLENLFLTLGLGLLLCWQARANVVDQAVVYLPFDGIDTGINSDCWKNYGSEAYGEYPSLVGTEGANTATITSSGLSGDAYDGSMMGNQTLENVYTWGSEDPNVADTPIEEALKDPYSFTVCGWIRTDALTDQGRIAVTSNMQINYRGNHIEFHLIDGGEWVGSWVKSNTDPGMYPSVDHWRFFAVTFDGSTTPADANSLNFYTATEHQEVVLDSQYARNDSQFPAGYFSSPAPDPDAGCFLTVGNSRAESDRPFQGYVDELRIWVSKTDDSSGALSTEELELVRQTDLGMCEGGNYGGDVNKDCYVDILDFGILAANWLSANPLN
jgi:hypothetical protein